MVKTWRLVTQLVKNRRFKGLTSLDSFPTKNVKFEMQCRVTGTCYVDHPYVILINKTGTFKIIPELVTSALVCAPELENAEIQVQFSRQKILVNTASLKLTSEKRFEILRQFAIEWRGGFFIAHLERYQCDFKVGQKTQNLTGKFFFAKRMWVL